MATATVSLQRSAPAASVAGLAFLPIGFAFTLFVSATLLFVVQPMFAKMVLPLLGGTPAVWNTCLVFYQAALLAGYAYAHFLTTHFSVRRQVLIHTALLLAPLFVLPIGVAQGWLPQGETIPVPWLLGLLTVSVGLPFVVVSTSAPLLQKWFAGSGHPSARDPYFLYSASNLGSMLALVSYPFLLEPLLRLSEQSSWWAVGYGVLACLVLGCAWLLLRAPDSAAVPAAEAVRASAAERPTRERRLHWVALALVPSSLMMGVTTHLTTDIAPIPLLWLVPLGLYLLSFILVFSRAQERLRPWMVRLLPMTTLVLVALLVLEFRPPLLVDVGLHLVGFFVVAMVCHGELARLRPASEHLTEFYLLMSLGGVLGGLCNALLAPLLFTTVLEFPLALVAAALLTPPLTAAEKESCLRYSDVRRALEVGAFTGLVVGLDGLLNFTELFNRIGGPVVVLLLLLKNATVVGVCYTAAGRPLRFGLAIAAMLLVGVVRDELRGNILSQDRSFFGQVTVLYDTTHEYRWMLHGTTLHGQQSLDPALAQEPLSYFHRTGPVGQLFGTLTGPRTPKRVGVTGLGVGTLVAYGEKGQAWTFYEIDPLVVRVARDTRYFTYLADGESRGVDLHVELGDARLQLVKAPAHSYDLLILDAFSSDSVPVHLLTQEAVQLYLSKLTDDGMLLFNISNRYLRLEPMMARQARAAGLVGYFQHDGDVEGKPGKERSSYVVLARRPEVLGTLVANGKWQPLAEEKGVGLWTDDFSNLFSVLKWRP
jgi:hypothetical protein